MDKPLPAQHLNRPMAPKRPRNPERFRNIDVTPGDSQQDPQYQRMIEALQQRQGWLAGRGAFDKDDLLYLRDKEAEQHFQEQRKRDAEAAAFAAARARAEAQAEQQAVKQLRQQEAARPQHKTHPAPLLGIVSVKPVKQQKHREHQQLLQPKPAAADSQQWQQQQQQQPQGPSQQQEVCQPRQQPAKKARTDASPSQQAQGVSPGQGTGAGHVAADTNEALDPLQNLLGDYGSEGESDDDGQQQVSKNGNAQQQCAAGNAVKLQLPSAELLLDSELHSSIAQGGPHASGDEVTGQTAVVHDVKRLFDLHNHGSWV